MQLIDWSICCLFNATIIKSTLLLKVNNISCWKSFQGQIQFICYLIPRVSLLFSASNVYIERMVITSICWFLVLTVGFPFIDPNHNKSPHKVILPVVVKAILDFNFRYIKYVDDVFQAESCFEKCRTAILIKSILDRFQWHWTTDWDQCIMLWKKIPITYLHDPIIAVVGLGALAIIFQLNAMISQIPNFQFG